MRASINEMKVDRYRFRTSVAKVLPEIKLAMNDTAVLCFVSFWLEQRMSATEAKWRSDKNRLNVTLQKVLFCL